MAEVAVKPAPTKEKRYIINVSLGNDNEPRKQYVGANGRDFLIERGVDIEVPQCVLNVLDDAVIGIPEVDPNDQTKTIVVERKRFPYSIKGIVE